MVISTEQESVLIKILQLKKEERELRIQLQENSEKQFGLTMKYVDNPENIKKASPVAWEDKKYVAVVDYFGDRHKPQTELKFYEVKNNSFIQEVTLPLDEFR